MNEMRQSEISADIQIAPMQAEDYQAVRALWEATDGVGLDASDDREHIISYLQRNPGLSLVARDEKREAHNKIVGAVLCGYDGRRGDLCHLAVAVDYRGRGIGRRLVEECLARLHTVGMLKCNIRVYCKNADGQAFWRQLGFAVRNDLAVMQRTTSV